MIACVGTALKHGCMPLARSLAVSLLCSSFSRIHLKYTRICREQAVRSSDYWTVYKFVASQSLHNTIFF